MRKTVAAFFFLSLVAVVNAQTFSAVSLAIIQILREHLLQKAKLLG